MATTKKVATKRSAAPAVAEPKVPAKRGRVGRFEGKKIYKLKKEWHGRQGTLISVSANLVRTGMTYATYLEQGGRYIDLIDMVNQEFVEVK